MEPSPLPFAVATQVCTIARLRGTLKDVPAERPRCQGAESRSSMLSNGSVLNRH
jgi:hypothetical protein